MLYVVSDNHFFHKNILKFSPNTRRGVDAEEMSWLQVDAINSRVREGDELVFLGDFSFGNAAKTLAILRAIKCQHKRLVLGNHDQVMDYKEVAAEFISIEHYRVLKHEGKKYVCFHFPIYEWYGAHRGDFHLFGHVHGSLNHMFQDRKCMDVGVDARDDDKMEPWSIEEIYEKLKDRPSLAHHGKLAE